MYSGAPFRQPIGSSFLEKTIGAIDLRMPTLLRSAWQHMRANVVKEVFISCFSEHWPSEDAYGRLSMWRDPDGIALVLNVEPFRLESNALNAYSSPVFYGEIDAFSTRLKTVLTKCCRQCRGAQVLNVY